MKPCIFSEYKMHVTLTNETVTIVYMNNEQREWPELRIFKNI